MPLFQSYTEQRYQRLTAGAAEERLGAGRLCGLSRITGLVCLCCVGSFLFAYDTGIVGGILTLPSFQHDFNYTDAEKTIVNSNAVSVLQAGAFVGCFLIWPLTSSLGRRIPLIICSFVFCLGAVLQTVNSHDIMTFYAGRVISGLGVGGATVLIPMFSSEMSPKEVRGKLGSCFQLFFAFGVCVSYWINYIMQIGVSPTSSAQWQIPVGLQLLPGALLGVGMLFVKDSARWLAQKGRTEDAFSSLKWVRGGDDNPGLHAEFAEIQAGIKAEAGEAQVSFWDSLTLPSNRYRIFLAVTIQLCAQLTGNSSLAYYAPQIFEVVGAGDKNLLVTGFFGLSKIAGVATFQFLLVERIGRKRPFVFGAVAMGIAMLGIAGVAATYPLKERSRDLAGSGIVATLLIYCEAFLFNMTWGPLPWLYISEIFPPGLLREVGVALGAASQWIFNFMMSQATPHMLANLGWKTFLLFAIMNFAIVPYSLAFLKETRGRSLEEMDAVFGIVKIKGDDGSNQSTPTDRFRSRSP